MNEAGLESTLENHLSIEILLGLLVMESSNLGLSDKSSPSHRSRKRED